MHSQPDEYSPLLKTENGKDGALQISDSGTEGEKGASYWVTVANVVKANIGTSMLSLPWAFAGSGMFPGIFVMAVSIFTTGFCAATISRACRITGDSSSIPVLTQRMARLPSRVRNSIDFFLVIFCLIQCGLALVSYVVLAADSMIKVFGMSRLFWSPIFSILIFFPLSLFKLKDLWITSVIGLSAAAYCFFLICYYRSDNEPVNMCWFDISWEWLTVAGVSTQSTCLFYCIPPMYMSMENRRDFPKAAWTGYFISFLFYAAFAFMGYLHFGLDVQGDILLNLPESLLSQVARLAQLVCVTGSFPLIYAGLLTTMEAQLFGQFVNQTQKIFFSFCCHILFCAFSLWLPNLGILNSINGSLAIGVLSFAFPSLLAYYLLQYNGNMMILYTCLGLFISVGSLIFSNRQYVCDAFQTS